MTFTPWATASCVAIIPTEPAAPRMSRVSPRDDPELLQDANRGLC